MGPAPEPKKRTGFTMALSRKLALVLVAALLALAWWGLASERRGGSAIAPDDARAVAGEQGDPAPDPVRKPPGELPTTDSTARDYLAKYWGDRWPSIEAEMIEQGVNLDLPFVATPWEEVSSHFEPLFKMSDEWREAHRDSRVDWPVELTRDWLVQEFPMAGREGRVVGERELAEIEDLCWDVNSKIYEEFELFTSGIDRGLQDSWIHGRFTKAPFSTYGVTPVRDDRAFYASAASFGGWAISVQLYEKDHPDVVAADRAMARLRDQRESLVVNYLRSL